MGRGIALLFLGPSALDGLGGSAPRSGRVYLWERRGNHCTGYWVGPRAGLDRCGKSRPPPKGFDPRTVQPGSPVATLTGLPGPSDPEVSGNKNVIILGVNFPTFFFDLKTRIFYTFYKSIQCQISPKSFQRLPRLCVRTDGQRVGQRDRRVDRRQADLTK